MVVIQDTPRDRRLTFVAAQRGSKSGNPLCPSWQKLWLLSGNVATLGSGELKKTLEISLNKNHSLFFSKGF